jgi:multidrug resistance protein
MHLARVSITQAAEYAGWLGAGYAVMQFVFAPVIGNLSDRFGRRPVLLAAVFALGLDYLLQAFAPAMSWLIAGRIIAGITGASFSAAYAYIADVTPPEKRAASFGLMGMAFGIGFVLGPALGGLLGTLGPRVPFMAAAGLSLANFLFGFFTLRESLDADHRRPFDWRRANALSSLRALKGQSAVLWFVAALGAWQLANVVYPAIWTYMAIAAYGFSTKAVGWRWRWSASRPPCSRGWACAPCCRAWGNPRRCHGCRLAVRFGRALLPGGRCLAGLPRHRRGGISGRGAALDLGDEQPRGGCSQPGRVAGRSAVDRLHRADHRPAALCPDPGPVQRTGRGDQLADHADAGGIGDCRVALVLFLKGAAKAREATA